VTQPPVVPPVVLPLPPIDDMIPPPTQPPTQQPPVVQQPQVVLPPKKAWRSLGNKNYCIELGSNGVVQLAKCGGSNQSWRYDTTSGHIQFDDSNKCLDATTAITGGSTNAHTRVGVKACTDAPGQSWVYKNNTVCSGSYCLDAEGIKFAAGVPILAYYRNGQINQKWDQISA